MARILLVDDERDIREMLRDALALRGHQVDLAESGRRALELATASSYEVAIIDYVLPAMRGLDVLQKLRKKIPSIRSIIISGQIDHDEIDPGRLEKELNDRTAADRYLPKPVAIDDLLSAIESLLEPFTGKEMDWKKLAGQVVATRRVKAKDVRKMNSELKHKRKKPKK